MSDFNRIDSESEVPKYLQVEEMIVTDIESGIFKQGQRIPSINETSEDLLLSRDTVEKAYANLRKKGVLVSVKGKGYYVNQITHSKRLKIALIINKLSNYKRSLYNSFVQTTGNKASVDVFIYHYDIDEFETIINENQKHYDYFVILPHFRNDSAAVVPVIRKIPKEKVLIVDRYWHELHDYPVVYQEYDKDIQTALGEAIELLRKYQKLNLVFPQNEYYSTNIKKGFTAFCQHHRFDYAIIDKLTKENIREDQVYILISDNDLYMFIKFMKGRGWKAGREIGLISYNENPFKELLCDGISTISTNHDEIGKQAAEMILSRNFRQIKSPFEFIKRNSL
ncbi:GntR family transcriptional regulator [Mangrovibacterium marinum]|uniref:DNA-binding LacI/PurR family transcriptional regulator n=1 Tax=Mangrovibacterium marinum TaxID=1639118 RepID=A0A2T5C4G9_9BACT|nr:GntR family transcriptional regulator [Mangrovibacterium marinum]PTN09765.1 DNA-binding LacI/PurR family transcriptional regulator [Mangrovibacterium marinum]